ncbi:MAG: type II toxin-antitoxin system HipA family toxin [Pseudobdellovibrionaceae bacterium]
MICKICLKENATSKNYPDYHNVCLSRLFDSTVVSPILQFNRDIFKTEMTKKYVRGMSISGVQKKLSLKIANNTLSLTDVGGTYILKPTVEDFPELSQNEHLSMLIGKALDIETPPLGLIKFSNDELTYVIKRFDWKGNEKIHKEDMTSIFNLSRDKDETYKYGQSYEQVGLKIREITNGKMGVVLGFFNRLVYNFLIQNADFHLKNISVVADKLSRSGFYDTLAPNYDSAMTRLYLPNEHELALAPLKDDETPEAFKTFGYLTRPDFEQLALKIGLTTAAAALFFEKIKKRKNEIFELIDNSFLGDSLKEKYRTNLVERMKQLKID